MMLELTNPLTVRMKVRFSLQKKKIFLRNSYPCSEVHILGQEESVCLSSRGGGEEVSWLGSHFKN